MPDIPERMHRKGQPEDQEFEDPDELLYRRFPDTEYRDGELFLDQLKVEPAMSVVRSRYADPHDVLYDEKASWHFDDYGVFSFPIRSIPGPMAQGSVVTYSWKPHHAPLEKIYAHSELWTGKNGVYSEKTEVSNRIVKKYLRNEIRRGSKIVYKIGEARYLAGT